MKRRSDADELTEGHTIEALDGEEDKLHITRRRLGPTIFFALKAAVGIGGIALFAHPSFFLGEPRPLVPLRPSVESTPPQAGKAAWGFLLGAGRLVMQDQASPGRSTLRGNRPLSALAGNTTTDPTTESVTLAAKPLPLVGRANSQLANPANVVNKTVMHPHSPDAFGVGDDPYSTKSPPGTTPEGNGGQGNALARTPQEVQLEGFAAPVQALDSGGRRPQSLEQTDGGDREIDQEASVQTMEHPRGEASLRGRETGGETTQAETQDDADGLAAGVAEGGESQQDQAPQGKIVKYEDRHDEKNMVPEQGGPQLPPQVQQTSHHQPRLQPPQDVGEERLASTDRNASISNVLKGVHPPSKPPPLLPLHENVVTPSGGLARIGPAAVWSTLSEAVSLKGVCLIRRCGMGKHMHKDYANFARDMSRVRGAIVVTRVDLIQGSDEIAPAKTLDFVETLRYYFPIFKSSFLPRELLEEHVHKLPTASRMIRFLDAVKEGNDQAGKFLSTYHTKPDIEVKQPSSRGYEGTPTIAALADVWINQFGYVWNNKDLIIPKSCKTAVFGASAKQQPPRLPDRHGKVFILTQHWGGGYFHFLVECLPRITLMLDVLLEHKDIKVVVHKPNSNSTDRDHPIFQFLELLGIQRDRVILVGKEIHAGLAILPESTACGQPNTAMINMLRARLLQGMYPLRGGIPRPVPQPVIILVVRKTKRGLGNSFKILEALKDRFPTHEVVEFFGEGLILQQLELFATGSLIIAPHGAGLSNIIVSPLHTPVLEIGPPACSMCYVHLTLKLHHIYARHLAGSRWNDWCDSFYEPDVNEIVQLASDLLEAQKILFQNRSSPSKNLTFEEIGTLPATP